MQKLNHDLWKGVHNPPRGSRRSLIGENVVQGFPVPILCPEQFDAVAFRFRIGYDAIALFSGPPHSHSLHRINNASRSAEAETKQ